MPALPSDHPSRPPSSNSPSSSSPTSDPPASLSEWGSNNPFRQSSYASSSITSRYSTADSRYHGSSSSRAGVSSSLSDPDRKQYGALPLANDGSAPTAPSASASSSLLPPAYDSSAAAPPNYGEVVPVDEFGEFSSRPTIIAAVLSSRSSSDLPHLKPLLAREHGQRLARELYHPTGPPTWSLELEGAFSKRSRQEWEELRQAAGEVGRKAADLKIELSGSRWVRKKKLAAEIAATKTATHQLSREYGLVLYYLRRAYWVYERQHGVDPCRILPRLRHFLPDYSSTVEERDAHEEKLGHTPGHALPSVGSFDAGNRSSLGLQGRLDMSSREEEAFWAF
ncbi:hypothetical protein JCM8097_008801 [Rhodosporidiobolus ruineniae]